MRRLPLLIVLALIPTLADASPVLWQYSGTVETTAGSSTVIPVGATVELDWLFDPGAASESAPQDCLYATASSVTFRILGGSFTAPATYTWLNGFGFGPGVCGLPGANTGVEVVVPGTWIGSTLAGDSVIALGSHLQGGFSGFITSYSGTVLPVNPPLAIELFSPEFWFSAVGFGNQSETFTASLKPVPEPAPLLLAAIAIGLAAVRRRLPLHGRPRSTLARSQIERRLEHGC